MSLSKLDFHQSYTQDDSKLDVKFLGLVDYEATWKKMQAFTQTRSERDADEIWVLEHKPIFTLGQASKPEHLLNTGEIPVLQTDRGGQVTYHGPGQLVIYPLIDLKRLNIAVRPFVSMIENAIIESLQELFEISAYARTDAPGVYIKNETGEAKIASLGLRIKRGASFHGLSLNIDMSLEPFSRINPCGYADMQMTQLSQLPQINKQALNMDRIAVHLVDKICGALGYTEDRKISENE